MCEAIEQLKSRATENGIRIGTENGIRIGTDRGIRIGKKEQKKNSAMKMRNMQISCSDMMEILDCNENELAELLEFTPAELMP